MIPRPHGAKFSRRHLEVLEDALRPEAKRLELTDEELRVLDPFAGVGLIHRLPFNTVGVELEPEWACGNPRTVVGDARRLPFPSGSFHAVATSPTYANRMADAYDGSGDTCTRCEGNGLDPEPEADMDCGRCGGSGKAPSSRNTYRIKLGRQLSDGNTGGMQWGRDYRQLHRLAWTEAVRVVMEGGLLVVNVSDHVRTTGSGPRRRETYPPVVEFHLMTLARLGCYLVSAAPISTQRYRHGQNSTSRVAYEHLLVFRVGRPTLPSDA